MNRALRKEYLAAMGLQSWVARVPAPAAGPEAPLAEAPLAEAPDAPPAAAREAGLDWNQLRARVAACTRCSLSATRTQTVFGVGNPQAEWLIVGEAPGAEEDRQGEPFVGRAGQLLNSMLRAIGLARAQVYHRQRAQVPAAGQPRSERERGRRVSALPGAADRAC